MIHEPERLGSSMIRSYIAAKYRSCVGVDLLSFSRRSLVSAAGNVVTGEQLDGTADGFEQDRTALPFLDVRRVTHVVQMGMSLSAMI